MNQNEFYAYICLILGTLCAIVGFVIILSGNQRGVFGIYAFCLSVVVGSLIYESHGGGRR